MTDLFLLAVKSRGQPTFEIGERMACPECDEGNGRVKEMYCEECADEGYWWITNSGYRAHPFRTWNLDDIYDGSDYDAPKPMNMLDTMPDDAPDLFPCNASPKSSPFSGKALLAKLGLIQKVVRRL